MIGIKVSNMVFDLTEGFGKNWLIVFAAMMVMFCSACSENMLSSVESNTLPAETNPAIADNEEKPEHLAVERQRTALPQLLDYTAVCEEIEKSNPDSEDAILVKTCTFRNYKAVQTGTPDYKGRYSYTYKLYRAEAGQYLHISNKVLFNDKQNELLALVNQKIKADYLQLANALETKECFEGTEPIEDFEMNELGISFEADEIVFHAEFGLSDACLAVDGTSVSFPLREIDKYLNK